jgi:Spy/CpxP family protein refolding chaperone
MKMHKFGFAAALMAGALMTLTPTLRAEDAKPAAPEAGPRAGQRGEMAKERLAKLAEQLDLTAEQKTKVAAAMKEQAETLRGVREATPEERREKMQAARKAMDGKLKEILTAGQYAKWEKARAQRGAGGQRRSGPGGEKPEKN